MTTAATGAALAAQPILRSLPPLVLDQLSALPVLELPAGKQVFDTGMQCAGFPIILSGMVRVFRHLANGRRIELYRVTPDEACILSLACVFSGGQYPATGMTSAATRLIVMPPALFNQCLAVDERFRIAIFRALGDRLVHTMELVEEVATLRLDVRLASALLAHVQETKSVAEGGPLISITHQELADELGTVREMVSRLLDDFSEQGMAELGRGKIRLRDMAKLQALASTR